MNIKNNIFAGRLLLIVVFFLIFSFVSFVYFYFTFYNFYIVKEEVNFMNEGEDYFPVSADTSKQIIPKSGFKLEKDRYYFDQYLRKIEHNQVYRAVKDNDTIYFKVIGH